MPGLNAKGPQGEGSLTGRGMGKCRTKPAGDAGSENDNSTNSRPLRMGRGIGAKKPGSGLMDGSGRGLGRGAGRGLRRGNRNN
jgi:hypothetical protein